MDGGSSDNSVEIIERYADKLAYWQSKPDRGQANAITKGFEMATGEILGWINSDDLLLERALTSVGYYFAANPGCHFLVGDCVSIDGNDRILYKFYASPPSYRSVKYYRMTCYQPSCFWRKSSYQLAGGINTKLKCSFDRDLFIRLLRQGKTSYINRCLSAFRGHAESKTSTLSGVFKSEHVTISKKYALDAKFEPLDKVLYLYYAGMRMPKWLRRRRSQSFFSHTPCTVWDMPKHWLGR